MLALPCRLKTPSERADKFAASLAKLQNIFFDCKYCQAFFSKQGHSANKRVKKGALPFVCRVGDKALFGKAQRKLLSFHFVLRPSCTIFAEDRRSTCPAQARHVGKDSHIATHIQIMADNTANADRLKALQAAMAKIEKDFGKGSIMKLGDEHIENVEVIPTGSLALNAALGVGGYPKGRIIEIYGPESSGKTTLAIHAIAECQKAGGIAAFIDAEHAFDRFYAAKLGVNVDDLLISQPDNGEQALEIADQLIRSSAIDILVVDSVAALTPKAEIEGDMGDNKVGLQARLMSQALRKLTASISKTNTTCIFINQLREKIGVMFGNPETTTGGNALKFYASVRLDIRRVTTLKDGDTPIGNQVRVKVVKNKVAPPFRKAEFEITFGEGISHTGEVVDLGVDCGIIKKSGSWFSYGDTRLGQGRDAVKKVIKDNPELSAEIEEKIAEALKQANEE